MSISFGIGEFIVLGKLAWSAYKSCKNASENFDTVSLEILSLHAVVKEFEDNLIKSPLPTSQLAALQPITENCNRVLRDLQSIADRYRSLGTKSRRTWDRVSWGKEDIANLRSRLISGTALLNAFIR